MKVQWRGDNADEVRNAFGEVGKDLKPEDVLPCWPVFRDLSTPWPKMDVNWPDRDDPLGAPKTTDVPVGWWLSWSADRGVTVSMQEPAE